jgi:hypothetical protein
MSLDKIIEDESNRKELTARSYTYYLVTNSSNAAERIDKVSHVTDDLITNMIDKSYSDSKGLYAPGLETLGYNIFGRSLGISYSAYRLVYQSIEKNAMTRLESEYRDWKHKGLGSHKEFANIEDKLSTFKSSIGNLEKLDFNSYDSAKNLVSSTAEQTLGYLSQIYHYSGKIDETVLGDMYVLTRAGESGIILEVIKALGGLSEAAAMKIKDFDDKLKAVAYSYQCFLFRNSSSSRLENAWDQTIKSYNEMVDTLNPEIESIKQKDEKKYKELNELMEEVKAPLEYYINL